MNSTVEKTQVVIAYYHGGPGHKIWLGDFIKHSARRVQVASLGVVERMVFHKKVVLRGISGR